MSLNPSSNLSFKKASDGKTPKTYLEITNTTKSQNVAYKIKTTGPKIFVVKPNQGILPPAATTSIDLRVLMDQLGSIGDLTKHKFMVQAVPTGLEVGVEPQ